MSRNRFVQPKLTRLFLADVHKRAHQTLLDRKDPKATPSEIAESTARVQEAEEDGAFIDVKRELNAGEVRHSFAQIVKEMRGGEKALLDVEKVGFAKIVEYLMGWSLTDANGPVPVTEDAINNLDQDTYREIVAAIDAHEEAIEKEKATRKNTTGETPAEAISPSVAS